MSRTRLVPNERKVLTVGDSFAVSLPKDWARERGLISGLRVLVITDDKLILEPYDENRVREPHELVERFVEEDSDG